MPRAAEPVELSEEQVLWFRARRGHLAGPGAADPVAAARALLGAQSQQLPPSLLALSLRTAGRPTAAAIERLLFEEPRRLVRTWGQRDTLFLFDPEAHWAEVVAARARWAPGGRRGVMPSEKAIAAALDVMRSAGRPITRSDLFHLVSPALVAEAEEKVGRGEPARRLVAARLVWVLAHRGIACVGEKVGAEVSYALRSEWFPELPWPGALDPEAAAARLAAGYLATYGPATAADVAHFFNARVGEVRGWLEALERASGVVPVACGGRRGLVARAADLDDLAAEPPGGFRDWPVRLLPLWDSLLMAHKDKSWTVPAAAEEKRIWRKAGYVTPVVLARGRIVAIWSHAVSRGRLAVEVEPLGGWRKSRHLGGVRREAREVAAHLELAGADVTVAG